MSILLSFLAGVLVTFSSIDAWLYSKALKLSNEPLFNFWPGSGFYELSKAVRLHKGE